MSTDESASESVCDNTGRDVGDTVTDQVGRSGGVSDSYGGRNCNVDQDISAELHNMSSFHGQASLNETVHHDNSGEAPMTIAQPPGDDLLLTAHPGTGITESSPGHEPASRVSPLGESDQQLATDERLKLTLVSDTNNNDPDADIDSSDCDYNKREVEGDTFGSSGDISNLHISSSNVQPTLASKKQDHNYSHSSEDNTTSDNIATASVRRRNLGKRTHGRREDNLDLIGQQRPAAALEHHEEQDDYDDSCDNWNEQQRYKKQKLKIMKADGKLGTNSSKITHHQNASAYFCRLSRSDFGASSGSSANKSSQSDISSSKCNDKESNSIDDSSSTFSASVRNFFTLSKFQRAKSTTKPSKLKRTNEIKLEDRKKERSYDIIRESEDTSSSVTDEEKQPSDMPVTTSKSGYKTFKSSKRRVSRGENQPRESQHRLSQTSGYSKLDHHHYRTTNENSFLQELKRVVLLLVIILISCVLLWQVYELLLESYNFLGVVKTPSILGEYNKYAVSTDAEPCAKVGSDLLANGGSAVDAAVGTLLCMGVILPNSLGLGGGCLMTIYDAKKKEAVIIDGRETAPDYATENMFANDSLKASRGPLSVAVPGELAAYWEAHKRYGKLNWSHLFNNSIKFAEEGYPMVEHLANALKNQKHAKYLSPPLAKLFTNPQGEFYKQGEVFAQPQLAATLKRLQQNGADEFYKGQTGQNFIQDLKDQGGKMTLENLQNYKPQVRLPLEVKLADDLILHTQPPPGSGIVLSIILRLMHKLGYYKNLKPQASFEAAELYYHRLAESFKFAYGQRAGLEDMPDDPARMKQLMDKLLSEKFIDEMAAKVDTKTHDNAYYGGLEYFSDDHGTAHVSVLDSEGNAAAVSTSVNLYFGAGIYSPKTGITYNDVMDDFVSPNLVNKFGLAPSKYNRIKPGRRPLSSMVPSVFTDSEGNVRLVLGGAGGTMITTGVAMVSLRNCFLGEDVKTSVDGPRLHHQFLPNKLSYEINFPKDLIHSLHVIRNHTTEAILGRSSVIMAIASERLANNRTRITANSDYRKGGSVHGQ